MCRKFLLRHFLCAVCFLLVAGLPTRSESAQIIYDIPPYANQIYRCETGVGCCSPPGIKNQLHEMFAGLGMFAGKKDLQKDYYLQTLFPKIEEALKKSADDIRNSIVFAIASKGDFLDAQNFLQSMLSLQKQDVKALQNYTMSDQVCRFGTLSRSLSNSQDKTRIVQIALAAKMARRQALQTGMVSGYPEGEDQMIGRSVDKKARFNQYKTKFCNPKDLAEGVKDPVCLSPNEMQHNRDINVTRTWSVPLTLDIDFSPEAEGENPTKDEENIFALSSNLYAHDLPVNFNKSDIQLLNTSEAAKLDSAIEKLLEFRSVEAKRSVANNSFAALAAMKSAGSVGEKTSTQYLRNILVELGIEQAQVDVDDLELRKLAAIGKSPSYYAQMDFLTRKLSQSPQFYANLMDSPTNLERQSTSLEAIGLMQDRDIFESLVRSESLLSVLLETYLDREQVGYKDKGVK